MKSRKFPLLFSGIMFALSLFLPPFTIEGTSAFNIGFVVLLFGLAYGHIAWYANLFYAASLLTYGLLKKMYIPVILSGVAFALALTAMNIKDIPRDEGTMSPVAITKMGWGFYCWLSSIAIIMLAAATDSLSREAAADEPA